MAEHPIPERVRGVIWLTAREHRVSVDSILDHSRRSTPTRARQVAMWRVRQLSFANGYPPSFVQIGRWFKRHHTTVLHACRVIGDEQIDQYLSQGMFIGPVASKRDCETVAA